MSLSPHRHSFWRLAPVLAWLVVAVVLVPRARKVEEALDVSARILGSESATVERTLAEVPDSKHDALVLYELGEVYLARHPDTALPDSFASCAVLGGDARCKLSCSPAHGTHAAINAFHRISFSSRVMAGDSPPDIGSIRPPLEPI